MVKYPTFTIVYDRRRVSNKTKRGSVEIAMSYKGKRTYFGTGVRVFPIQWNSTKKCCKGFARATESNSQIMATLAKLTENTETLWRDGQFSIQSLKCSMEQKDADVVFPIEWIRSQAEIKPVRKNTKLHIKVAVDALERCGYFRRWSDFTYNNIKKFDDFVRMRGIQQASIHNYHKFIKPFIDEAVKHGFLDRSPYDTFKSPRGESDTIRFLSDDERERIENIELPIARSKVRDCFVFSCYTGLCYSDLLSFSKNDIVQKDGARYIQSNRIKTGNRFVTILPDKAYSILVKYNFKLPMMTNQAMNRGLKKIAKLAGIEKNVTMHVARHTFATWALHNGVPISTVSKTLGHSSVKTTEIYAKVIEDDVMNQISKLK